MKRILIIDDSKVLLDVMTKFLELKDYRVKTLTSCDQLIGAVNEFDPDIIIIDVFLAGEDGREVCQKLRNNEQLKHLCILLSSGSAEVLKNYKDYGADDFIEKPFDITDLLRKIEDVLLICKE